jgi:hypothetical protein
MLVSINLDQEIRAILHRNEFEVCESRLTNEEYARFYDQLYAYCETDGIHMEIVQDDHY